MTFVWHICILIFMFVFSRTFVKYFSLFFCCIFLFFLCNRTSRWAVQRLALLPLVLMFSSICWPFGLSCSHSFWKSFLSDLVKRYFSIIIGFSSIIARFQSLLSVAVWQYLVHVVVEMLLYVKQGKIFFLCCISPIHVHFFSLEV